MNIKDIANVIIKIESTLNNTPSVEVTAPPEPETRGFMAVDLTGASGVYLTLSRNQVDFTTFNLADPSFDVLAFDSFASLGQNGTSFAFVAWPEIMPPEEREISDGTGVCGIALSGSVITPRHPNGYTPRGITLNRLGVDSGQAVATPPFDVTPEHNTLTAKATPDVPAEQDIFYSLDGAVEGGTVTIESYAVIQFTPPIACTPTSFSFVPSVTLPPEKERLILRYTLEIDGEQGFLPTYSDGGWSNKPYREFVWSTIDNPTYGDSAARIASKMFGSYYDSPREHLRETFNSNLSLSFEDGDELVLSGQTVESISESELVKYQQYSALPANVKITFVVIDDLPSDAIDYTLAQFGGEVVINGCAVIEGLQSGSG